MRINTSLTTV